MATALSAFFPDFMAELPSCDEVSGERAVRNACIEFCAMSLAVRFEAAQITTTANVAEYPFVPPTDTQVIQVVQVRWNGYELDPVSVDELDDRYAGDWRTKKERSPLGYTQLGRTSLLLVPVPIDTSTLDMTLAIAPTRAAATVDDVLYNIYADTIAAGAKASLMMRPQTPYTNPQLAAANRQKFLSGVSLAKRSAYKSNTRGPLQARMRRI